MSNKDTRLEAIKRFLANERPVVIYTSLGKSKAWFFKWLARYKQYGVEGLQDQSKAPNFSPNKTAEDIEKLIVNIRKNLAAHSTKETFYAPTGADSIIWELTKLGVSKETIPSIATVNRILNRNGLIKSNAKSIAKFKIPYPTPPTLKPNDVHQLDSVGPRYINGVNGIERFFSLNIVDCFSKVAALRQYEDARNTSIADLLINAVWPILGIPRILQVDNMLSVKGSIKYPRSLGMIIRLCLLFSVEVLFIPVSEPQRNGVVESFNNTFEKIFFRRQVFNSLEHLKQESLIFENYYCHQRPHSRLNIEKHGSKIPFMVHKTIEPRLITSNFTLTDYKVKNKIKIPVSEGKVSFIRWVSKASRIDIFTEKFDVPDNLRYQYVKATILTKDNVLQIWHQDDLVKEYPYYLME